MVALKGVLFDLEDTLVETVYVQLGPQAVDQERRVVRNKLISLGIPESVFEGEVRHTLFRNRAFDWVDANMSSVEAARFHKKLNKFMKSIELWAAKQHTIFPDTLKTLSRLASEGFKMGLATNTSREATDYLLRKYCLTKFFPIVVTRDDASRLKPNPEIINIAVEQIGKPVEWLVGDDSFDAEAARDAGLKSIIVRRDGHHPSFKCDYFTTSLKGVVPLMMNQKT